MAANGKLVKSELAPIIGGELSIVAAASWNAKGGPSDSGLKPEGPEGSYRTYEQQVELWAAYQNGTGNLAAVPGTSNHGLGVAIDLAETWMRSWIDEHGARYGWAKTEAFSEWWHVNYIGGVSFPTFQTLQRGDKGRRVKHYTRRLAFIHKAHGDVYLARAVGRYGTRVEAAVRSFQRSHHLAVDGKIGPHTAGVIDAVFHRQYRARHKGHVPKGQHR